MRIRDIADTIERFAPLSLQESYDNSGLIVGRYEQEVHHALLAVDTMAASEEPEETKIYTQTEIERLSREKIIALATMLDYTMTTTTTDEKAAVVADFMAQQAAAQQP